MAVHCGRASNVSPKSAASDRDLERDSGGLLIDDCALHLGPHGYHGCFAIVALLSAVRICGAGASIFCL